MRVSTSLIVIGALLGASAPLLGQGRSLPPDTLLRAIEARGRALAAYDQAAWHATDAVLALEPTQGLVTHYIARPINAAGRLEHGKRLPTSGSNSAGQYPRRTVEHRPQRPLIAPLR